MKASLEQRHHFVEQVPAPAAVHDEPVADQAA